MRFELLYKLTLRAPLRIGEQDLESSAARDQPTTAEQTHRVTLTRERMLKEHLHCRAPLAFERYHASVVSIPSRSAIRGCHPASRNTDTSRSLRGVPSGFVGSQRVSPV